MQLEIFQQTGSLLITDQLSSPEPLSAGGWGQHFLRRREAEDGPRRLHSEDEVDVGNHHGETWQKGETETKTTYAAAEGCSHPVNQPGNRKQTQLQLTDLETKTNAPLNDSDPLLKHV